MIFFQQILRGFGQIMLQNNMLTGLLFIAGIAYGSINMALAALLAVLSATLLAKALKFDQGNLNEGIYGFSAALVGVAFLLFFKPIWITWLAVIVGGGLAAVLQHVFSKVKLPAFTLPFVLVTWLAFILANQMLPSMMAHASNPILLPKDYFMFPLLGFGQVIFQGSWIAGAVFLLAVAINAPLAAVYALAASTLTGIIALSLGQNIQDIAFGLLSFNAVLTAIVFAGPTKSDAVWCLLAVLFTLAISMLMRMHLAHLPQLTFPFVAASMIGVLLKRVIKI